MKLLLLALALTAVPICDAFAAHGRLTIRRQQFREPAPRAPTFVMGPRIVRPEKDPDDMTAEEAAAARDQRERDELYKAECVRIRSPPCR